VNLINPEYLAELAARREQAERSRRLREDLEFSRPACPACGGRQVDRRGHLECERCRRVTEGCCEGIPPLPG
jgi:hypothetical protein